jgi:hypothetical protein
MIPHRKCALVTCLILAVSLFGCDGSGSGGSGSDGGGSGGGGSDGGGSGGGGSGGNPPDPDLTPTHVLAAFGIPTDPRPAKGARRQGTAGQLPSAETGTRDRGGRCKRSS